MGSLSAVWTMLEKIGLDKCIIFCIVAICGVTYLGKSWAESTFSPKVYAQARNDAFELEVSEITKTVNQLRAAQLASSIRDTHIRWCNDPSEYWWTLLQNYQKEYRDVTNNGNYALPDCSSYRQQS